MARRGRGPAPRRLKVEGCRNPLAWAAPKRSVVWGSAEGVSRLRPSLRDKARPQPPSLPAVGPSSRPLPARKRPIADCAGPSPDCCTLRLGPGLVWVGLDPCAADPGQAPCSGPLGRPSEAGRRGGLAYRRPARVAARARSRAKGTTTRGCVVVRVPSKPRPRPVVRPTPSSVKLGWRWVQNRNACEMRACL